MGVQYYELMDTVREVVRVLLIVGAGIIAAWAAIKIYLNQKGGR
jgi:hypothetical protein